MMRFCQVCNNLLYPRENRESKKLEYYCKSNPCTFVEKHISGSCVFRNELIKDQSTRLEVVLSDNNKDPTLNRTKAGQGITCANCGHDEAVFFLADQTTKSIALQLIFVCCNSACGYKWMGSDGATAAPAAAAAMDTGK